MENTADKFVIELKGRNKGDRRFGINVYSLIEAEAAMQRLIKVGVKKSTVKVTPYDKAFR